MIDKQIVNKKYRKEMEQMKLKLALITGLYK